MINENENEAENKKQIKKISHNRPRARNGHKYTKYKMCFNIMIVISVTQHLSNI